MTPLPRTQAIREIETRRDALAREERAREELRATCMRNSWLVLGIDHPDAIGSREMDRLLRPELDPKQSNRAAYQFVTAGLNNRPRMARILGYDPLDGSEPDGDAVTPAPASPSAANQKA